MAVVCTIHQALPSLRGRGLHLRSKTPPPRSKTPSSAQPSEPLFLAFSRAVRHAPPLFPLRTFQLYQCAARPPPSY